MESDEPNNILKLNERVEHGDESYSHNEIRPKSTASPSEKDNLSIHKLKAVIRENISGCDLIICSFVAALKSYRIDGCLRPFPHYFINKENEKDFASVKSACDKIPPLKDFINLSTKSISKDVLNLLTWLFIDSGFPVLSPFSMKNLPLSIVNGKASINALPQYVFEVEYNGKYEDSWKKRIGNRDIFYAFHGSSVDNFYSILKFGLQQHFTKRKEVIFGNGIYLSNDISVCTNYAPFGGTWINSSLGNKHSIIAICEVINDEEEVKCKDEKNKRRSINQNSYGEIPEKYFVVTNSELVKVKYLLVYRYEAPSMVKSFVKKNFLWILIVVYFLTLVFIGFINGPYWRRFVRYLSPLSK